ncbi:UNVERIFIED_CONTAM: Asparagine--tRNA ligase, cytoplasmic 1, partial [Sesamum indicum]
MFGGGIPKKDGKIGYAEDSFARQGKHFLLYQNNCRLKHMLMCSVVLYTLRTTFRAEHSHTLRHLVEFRTVEPEIAFADIQ